MILSVSRRTDIPNYYSEWFLNRIKAGYLYVRNPINPYQISRIGLSPETVDCIVFWTKNPKPMLGRLDELKDYPFYFQFTLTGYGRDVEPGLPDKRTGLIPVFQELSDRIGSSRVIWRYDPIFFNGRYTSQYHRKAFREIAESLSGYTDRVVISFLDMYAKIEKNMERLKAVKLPEKELLALAEKLAQIAEANGMVIESCAERMDLQKQGIRHGSCIDRRRIEQLIGCRLKVSKDRNQRPECGCIESVEVGAYDTCLNGCSYCYANGSRMQVQKMRTMYDADAPLLCGIVGEKDRITVRNVRSLKETQMSLFDMDILPEAGRKL